jgi:hypothetical protein
MFFKELKLAILKLPIVEALKKEGIVDITVPRRSYCDKKPI